MREQVEALEDETDLGALAEDLALLELAQGAALAAVPDELAVERDEPLVDLLQVVDRAQQRRLPGAGRAEHDRHGPGRHGERHVAQHLEGAEALVDAVDLDEPGGRDVGAHAAPPDVRAVRVSTPTRARAAYAGGTASGTGRPESRDAQTSTVHRAFCSGVGGSVRTAPFA
ncbi:Uncharacterised protein [Mycobacteroides abscessus]|nr:Uncharacterised protein [Mycobacteroides abscessus]